MIRFWFRELMGWFLIGVGLFIFYICVAILLTPATEKFIETSMLTVIGIVVFRGGIHLMKVAVAARMAMSVADTPKTGPQIEPSKQKPKSPWDW